MARASATRAAGRPRAGGVSARPARRAGSVEHLHDLPADRRASSRRMLEPNATFSATVMLARSRSSGRSSTSAGARAAATSRARRSRGSSGSAGGRIDEPRDHAAASSSCRSRRDRRRETNSPGMISRLRRSTARTGPKTQLTSSSARREGRSREDRPGPGERRRGFVHVRLKRKSRRGLGSASTIRMVTRAERSQVRRGSRNCPSR